MTVYAGYGRFDPMAVLETDNPVVHLELLRDRLQECLTEICRIKDAITTERLEVIVTKAKQAFIVAVMNENYTGYEERFLAEQISKALASK